jgi:hypothetical protein
VIDASISLFDCTNELVFRMALFVVSILGSNSGNSKVTLKGDRVYYQYLYLAVPKELIFLIISLTLLGYLALYSDLAIPDF